jgi:hypothetical protein
LMPPSMPSRTGLGPLGFPTRAEPSLLIVFLLCGKQDLFATRIRPIRGALKPGGRRRCARRLSSQLAETSLDRTALIN